MCGRASLSLQPDELEEFLRRYGLEASVPWYTPRYNIAPSQNHVVIVEQQCARSVRVMRWGLVPSWAKDTSIGNRMINARSETVSSKPAFRDALARRRGLIVVDSYYEWRAEPSGPKTPFRIHRDDSQPFLLAALWERWGPHDEPLETCVVLTTHANERMAAIHERMPVIVGDDSAGVWLDGETSPVMVGNIMASDNAGFTAYAVSHYVNSPGNDSERCWDPAAEAWHPPTG